MNRANRWLLVGALIAPTSLAAVGNDPPSLQNALSTSDPVAREILIHHLIADRIPNQQPVVAAFAHGDLRVRVSALEILKAWNAPVDNLDPWQPETLTPARLTLLNHWAQAVPSPTTQAATLTPSAQADASTDLSRLLAATIDPERSAIRERLARNGAPLLPQLERLLQDRSLSDADLRQLTLLRYQLFVSDALLQRWPDGPMRITSSDAVTRRAAAAQLTDLVTDLDTPLLLQLFTDADSVIRELALRALQKAGGQNASVALAALLKDPEPNVRAAVLKEMTESPSSALIPQVVAYLHTETDEDLICYAIRVLRAAKNSATIDCLIALLDHHAWRIRAEAVAALAEIATGSLDSEGAASTAPNAAKATTSLIDHLGDPDSYVRSAIIIGLQKSTPPPAAIEKLILFTKTHPESTPDIVAILTNGDALILETYPQLKVFALDPNPVVRAQVITAVGASMGFKAKSLIFAALSDTDASVRIAAADVYRTELWKILPEYGQVTRAATWFSSEDRVAVDPLKWAAAFKKGPLRPRWLDEARSPLTTMQASTRRDERIAAAALNLALGNEDAVWPTLHSVTPDDKESLGRLSACLPWITTEHRAALFSILLTFTHPSWESYSLVEALSRVPDEHFLSVVWDLVAHDDALDELGGFNSILYGYYLHNPGPSGPAVTPDSKKLVKDLLDKARAGNEPQRLLALTMLAETSPTDALVVAKDLAGNSSLSPASRADAFQLLLIMSPSSVATPLAVSGLADPDHQELALRYLARGLEGLREFRGNLSVNIYRFQTENQENWAPAPHKPLPPKGLTADLLAPARNITDPESRISALYLLCLLKDRSALVPLETTIGEQPSGDDHTRILYRAIAAFNDDSLTPALERIYAGFPKNDYALREFYWTLRSVDGPHIRALCKKIHDECGAYILE